MFLRLALAAKTNTRHPAPIRKTCQSIITDTLARPYSDNSVTFYFFFFFKDFFASAFSPFSGVVNASYTISANFSAPLALG